MASLSFDALLFDLDGVLVDSTSCIERHWRRWADRHALDHDHVLSESHGRRTADTIRRVAPALDAEAEARLFEDREARDCDGVLPIDGASALLSSLHDVPWAIVTSGTHDIATNRMQAARIETAPVLVTADDVTNGKPHPEPFLVAASRLGSPPEHCIVFEDAPTGVSAAQAAGMTVVALPTTVEPADLANANYMIRDLSQVRVTSAAGRFSLELVHA